MNFDKESRSDFFEGGGGGLSNEIKYKKKKKKNNHPHNVEHVVQSTFQNMLITFKAQTLHL